MTGNGAYGAATSFCEEKIKESIKDANNYNELSNQPKVNGNTLIGDKSTSQLGITDGIELYINPATNVMTIRLKSGNTTVSEQTDTIPTASVVQNAYFDYTTQELVIIFTNGSELRLPFGELVGNMLPMAFNIQLASAGWQQITGTDNYELDLTQAINYILGLIPVYNVVTPEGTENPSEEGWCEKNGQGQYVLTEDTSVVEGKTYYELLHKTLTYNTKFDIALNSTNQSVLDASECEQIYFETYLDNGTPKLRAIAVDNSPANDLVVQFTMTQIVPNLQGQPLLSNALYKSGKNYVEKNLFLNKLYPTGSIIMTYDKVSPATYIGGTWDLISEGYYPVATIKDTIDEQTERFKQAGLPNITGKIDNLALKGDRRDVSKTGALSKSTTYTSAWGGTNSGEMTGLNKLEFDASGSNNIYGASDTVQPQSVLVYIWRRTDNDILTYNFTNISFSEDDFDVSETGQVSIKETPSPLKDKYLSIIGDSISTYRGWSNIAPGKTTAAVYYPNNGVSGVVSPITNVNQTYWKKLLDRTGLKLLVNNSWSGSHCAGTIESAVVSQSNDRCHQLHKTIDGVVVNPDYILINIGTNDFDHDYVLGEWNGRGELFPANPTQNSPTTFREAYAVMLYRLRIYYPLAKIFCCTIPCGNNEGGEGLNEINGTGHTLSEWNDAIREIASAFGVKVIEMATAGMDYYTLATLYGDNRVHPSEAGMERMYEIIRPAMENEFTSNTSAPLRTSIMKGSIPEVDSSTATSIEELVGEYNNLLSLLSSRGVISADSPIPETLVVNGVTRTTTKNITDVPLVDNYAYGVPNTSNAAKLVKTDGRLAGSNYVIKVPTNKRKLKWTPDSSLSSYSDVAFSYYGLLGNGNGNANDVRVNAWKTADVVLDSKTEWILIEFKLQSSAVTTTDEIKTALLNSISFSY